MLVSVSYTHLELDAAIKALDSKKERFSETVRTTYEQGETCLLYTSSF